jgi:ribonucleoside-diphosphate reductase alpha chain
MQIWDLLCQTLLATSSRRGAMMGTLRCDHPDISAFINAKREANALTNFNLSVLVTDAFMQAIAEDSDWQLTYPVPLTAGECQSIERLPARSLWRQIVNAAHETAEPGLLFIDRINRENNLSYCEDISATNPCGEIPLPPYGACDLGSINLTAFVTNPFSSRGRFDHERLAEIVRISVRFLDDVIDVSGFPLPQQAGHARNTRRIGLGITGLADALAMLGMHYDSDQALDFAAQTMELIRDTAYEASVDLATEKGAFPLFDKDKYLRTPFIQRLPAKIRDAIASGGVRNSHLLAIAPTGTISLLAGNVSSGIEPIYALDATRTVRGHDLEMRNLEVVDYAYDRWRGCDTGQSDIPEVFVTAGNLSAKAHLAMQARLQPYVDNAISKTVNLPADATARNVDEIYFLAYESGLKGCTVFRPGAREEQVIRARDSSHCCHVDREAD